MQKNRTTMQSRRWMSLTGIRSRSGSTLVGTVVLGVIMAIGIAGLIGVSRNTVSQEIDAHNDTRAFLAAEGGLDILTRRVTDPAFVSLLASGETMCAANNAGEVTIDGVVVELRLLPQGPLQQGLGNTYTQLCLLSSTASLSGELPYRKTIEKVMNVSAQVKLLETGAVGVALGTTGTSEAMRDTEFDGPVHFNGPIYINVTGGDYKVRFRGHVSVYPYSTPPNCPSTGGDCTPRLPSEKIGGGVTSSKSALWHENDYKYGVRKDDGAGIPTTTLDNLFLGPQPVKPSYTSDGKYMITDTSAANTRYVKLPDAATTLTFGVDATTKKTYINFNDGSGTATPHYEFAAVNAAGAPITDANGPVMANFSTDLVVLYAEHPLTVMHGTMLGRITVETRGGGPTGRDITIDLDNGHLVYDWNLSFTYNNKDHISATSLDNYHTAAALPGRNDVLGFNSSGDIRLLNDGSGTSKGKVLTAQLFANNPGKTLKTTDGHNKINLIGSASTNKFWHTSQNSGDKVLGGTYFHDKRKVGAAGLKLVCIDDDGTKGDCLDHTPDLPDDDDNNNTPIVSGYCGVLTDWIECNRPF